MYAKERSITWPSKIIIPLTLMITVISKNELEKLENLLIEDTFLLSFLICDKQGPRRKLTEKVAFSASELAGLALSSAACTSRTKAEF